MNLESIPDLFPFVWPLIVVLVVLFAMHKVSNEVRPIVVNVVSGLAKQASSNALGYGLAIGYGLSASLQSLAEQATLLHWMVLAAVAKVVNPCIVAMLAYAAKSDIGGRVSEPKNAGVTNPPIPPSSS